jgi:hypothetical protein
MNDFDIDFGEDFESLDFGIEFEDDDDDEPVIDRRDSDELVAEAESRGEVEKIRSNAKFVKYRNLHFQKLQNVKQLTRLPAPGEQFRLITQEAFNAYTFILYILEKETIEFMHLSTFNIKETIIDALFDLLKTNAIRSLRLMISESVRFRMPKRIEQLETLFARYKHTHDIKVKLNWNHSKIILIKTNQNNFYCIEGSGNLSDNAQIEQYIVDNNEDLYNFHKSWMDEAYTQNRLKREEIWE